MKFYVAELVATAIAFLCALTNHAAHCFVWRRLMPLDLWASNVMDARGVNQMHRFVNPTNYQPTCNCYEARVSTVNLNGSAMSYRYCPNHGLVKDA